MADIKRFQLKTVLVLFLFNISAESVDLGDERFRISPADKIIYYGRAHQQILQVCLPPDTDDADVEWRTGNETLKSNNRVTMFSSKNIEKYTNKPLPGVKTINVLEIKPVLPEDQGAYACVSVKSRKEAPFRIIFTDKCRKPFFVCSTTDEMCVANSTVCDGHKDCDDASDESVDSGCAYPSAPLNLRVLGKSWHQVKLAWDAVENAISYDIKNNENESIASDRNVVIFEGLRSGVSYNFFIRAKSYTGKSEFSKHVEVTTKLYSTLEIPQYADGLDFEGIGVLVSWMPIAGAESYQVLISFPDGSNNSVEVIEPEFILSKVIPKSLYSFRVRQWSGFEYGEYSEKIFVNTKPEKDVNNIPMNLTMSFNRTLSVSWEYSVILPNTVGYRTNTRLHELTYAISTCQLRPVYREWVTNETLVSDIEILDWVNKSDNNKIVKSLRIRNYTIHYDKKHKIFLYHKNYSCKITEREQTDNLNFKIEGLIMRANYSYKVLTYFSGRLIGQFAEGNFTVPESRQLRYKLKVANIFEGVVTYGIACGILLVLLFMSFTIAYYCKWDKLMADIAIKKARMKNQADQAEMDKVRPMLLKGSYINEHT